MIERPDHAAGRPSPVYALAIFLLGFALLLLASVLFALAGAPKAWSNLLSTVLELALYGLPVAIWYQRNPHTLPALRWKKLTLREWIIIPMAAVVGTTVLNLLAAYWVMLLEGLGLTSVTSSLEIPNTFWGLIVLLLSAAVTPAICEELLFRGLILPSMEGLGRRAAVVFSGLLFALLHAEFEALPVHILIGLILGMLCLRTGSLMAPMLYHFVHNATLMITVYRIERAGLLAAESETAPTLAEALSALPTLALFGVLWVVLLMLLLKRPREESATPPRERMPKLFWALLGLSLLVLLVMLGFDFSRMLP